MKKKNNNRSGFHRTFQIFSNTRGSLIQSMLAFGVIGASSAALTGYIFQTKQIVEHQVVNQEYNSPILKSVQDKMESMLTDSYLKKCPSNNGLCSSNVPTEGLCKHMNPVIGERGGLYNFTFNANTFTSTHKSYWENRWKAFFSDPSFTLVQKSDCIDGMKKIYNYKQTDEESCAEANTSEISSGEHGSPFEQCIRYTSEEGGQTGIYYLWATFKPIRFPFCTEKYPILKLSGATDERLDDLAFMLYVNSRRVNDNDENQTADDQNQYRGGGGIRTFFFLRLYTNAGWSC